MKFATFTKSFQDWPIPLVCHRFHEIGLDGLDLTVRPGGHIEPKDVGEALPAASRAALEAGVQILLLTTAVTDPSPEAEEIFATAAKLGILHIKLGYYRYEKFGTLVQQIDETRRRVAAMIELGKKHKVLPCIHIHSGAYIPSHGTLLYEVIRDFRPGEVGAYVDMLHMALEGGDAGWRQGLDLVAPWVALVAVKNFAWKAGERDRRGQLRWQHEVVPVADGISPVPEFMDALKSIKFDGTFSLHSEYKGKGSFKDLDTEACLAQTAQDLKHLRKLL